MEELRLVRREDRTLVVATETGEEFRLIVDETVLAELRQLSRRDSGPSKVSPREIQSLVRAGKSRAEIAELTGLEEADIERYEEPVLAERRYILELAQAVPVRTTQEEGAEQQFGTVIAERLVGLGAQRTEWTSWRDEEAGWMVALNFVSHDVAHRAVWTFEHRKGQLAPITPDAVTLSKQGEVGDRLIPKLRAVDDLNRTERFDSDAFDPEQLTAEFGDETQADQSEPAVSGPVAPDHPSTGSIPTIDMEAEFARRRSIDERAIKTPEPELPDLGQTADLLDALRRRRGERGADGQLPPSESGQSVNPPVPLPGFLDAAPTGAAPVDTTPIDTVGIDAPAPQASGSDETAGDDGQASGARRGKGRPSIPSWDDILFGTRSEEDPS
ncbi:MAG: septation protein SepH [Leucobacter sp.]